MKKVHLKATICWIFLAVTMLWGTGSASGGVNLSKLTIEPNMTYSSTESFKVLNPGLLKIIIRIRQKPTSGFINFTKYKIQLVKGSQVLKYLEVNASVAYKTVSIAYLFSSCDQLGKLKIRIRRTGGASKTGEAIFLPFNLPASEKKNGEIMPFSVKKGSRVTRNIPTHLRPTKIGKLTITASWKSACNFKQNGCQLLFRLKRNGNTVASSNGHSAKSTGGNKMKIDYSVNEANAFVGWQVEVKGDAQGDAFEVRPKISFISGCNL